VFASTSSVYGINTVMPFCERTTPDHPISMYSATKKANEAMAHAYAHLFGIPSTGLRFFTVYGPGAARHGALPLHARHPRGRKLPSSTRAAWCVTSPTSTISSRASCASSTGRPRPTRPGPESPRADTSTAPWRLYNIGNSQRIDLMRYIRALETALGLEARLELLPMQAGDVAATEADTSSLEQATGFRPSMPVEEGVRRFVSWYREYYHA
jgi:UDP-glucuronate 4-epimerase